jgi:hypothetical protein
MRIFFSNPLNINKINNLVKKYNDKTVEHYYEIYSSEGIFSLNYHEKNIIHKILITDVTPEYIPETQLWIDHSSIIKEPAYQIPVEHFMLEIEKTSYSLNDKSNLKFVMENVINGKDLYWYLSYNNTDLSFIQNELNELLSALQ